MVLSLSADKLLKSLNRRGGEMSDKLLKLLGGVRRKSPMEPQLDDDSDIILRQKKRYDE